MKYYDINRILQTKAKYNFIIGGRGTGKTVAITEYMYSRSIRRNVINYYVNDWHREFEYIQFIIEHILDSDYPAYATYKIDGIHYNFSSHVAKAPFIYTSKLNDENTWKKDYEQIPDNIVFDDVDFSNIDNVQKIFNFLMYVGIGEKTKIWIVGNSVKIPKDFLRQFLIKDAPKTSGIHTYDISEDVRISVEVI